MQRQLIRYGEFESVDHLADRIIEFINAYNQRAKPFCWPYDGRPLRVAQLTMTYPRFHLAAHGREVEVRPGPAGVRPPTPAPDGRVIAATASPPCPDPGIVEPPDVAAVPLVHKSSEGRPHASVAPSAAKNADSSWKKLQVELALRRQRHGRAGRSRHDQRVRHTVADPQVDKRVAHNLTARGAMVR